ncbi:MAG: hypothetical protein Q7S92_05870 [Candidatus Diapherotrites archaeon]|nr:hypothetical protein [Candidatus Diapherotrites archaeon]
MNKNALILLTIFLLGCTNGLDTQTEINQTNDQTNTNNANPSSANTQMQEMPISSIPVPDIDPCEDTQYIGLEPTEIETQYDENVCNTISYTEIYEETECHNERLSYSLGQLNNKSYLVLFEGCKIDSTISVKNHDLEKNGVFTVNFYFRSKVKNELKAVSKNILPQVNETFLATYSGECLAEFPSITVEVIPPEKEVCNQVTKTRPGSRQECHQETKTKKEIKYLPVQKNQELCNNESICNFINCDDHNSTTADECNESGCLNIPQNQGLQTNQVTQPQTEPESIQTICNIQECQARNTTSCQGTTKNLTTYYCVNNQCQGNITTEENSANCGYVEPQQITLKQEVEYLFNNFSEVLELREGSKINLYVTDRHKDFEIIRTSSGITVLEDADEGDISITLGYWLFSDLQSSPNVCAQLKYNYSIGYLNPHNLIKQKDDLTLSWNGYSNLLKCFS